MANVSELPKIQPVRLCKWCKEKGNDMPARHIVNGEPCCCEHIEQFAYKAAALLDDAVQKVNALRKLLTGE
jgi:hypothetical protein